MAIFNGINCFGILFDATIFMMKKVILFFLTCLSALSVVNAQPKFELVHHDSIPLTTVDSIITFAGQKVAIKDSKESAYYAALNPIYPVRQVFSCGRNAIDTYNTIGCFKGGGGLLLTCINYNVLINGDTVLISSPEKFREIFAPVDNPQEAIAFAYFFTGSEPMYNFDFLLPEPELEPQYMPFYVIDSISGKVTDTINFKRLAPIKPGAWLVYQPTITSSYVKKVEDGYELLLYFYKVFGCSHPYIERLIKVYTDGRVEIVEAKEAFEHSESIGFCVD